MTREGSLRSWIRPWAPLPSSLFILLPLHLAPTSLYLGAPKPVAALCPSCCSLAQGHLPLRSPPDSPSEVSCQTSPDKLRTRRTGPQQNWYSDVWLEYCSLQVYRMNSSLQLRCSLRRQKFTQSTQEGSKQGFMKNMIKDLSSAPRPVSLSSYALSSICWLHGSQVHLWTSVLHSSQCFQTYYIK